MVIKTDDFKEPGKKSNEQAAASDREYPSDPESQLERQENPREYPAKGDTDPPQNQADLEPDADVDWGIVYSPNDNDEN